MFRLSTTQSSYPLPKYYYPGQSLTKNSEWVLWYKVKIRFHKISYRSHKGSPKFVSVKRFDMKKFDISRKSFQTFTKCEHTTTKIDKAIQYEEIRYKIKVLPNFYSMWKHYYVHILEEKPNAKKREIHQKWWTDKEKNIYQSAFRWYLIVSHLSPTSWNLTNKIIHFFWISTN